MEVSFLGIMHVNIHDSTLRSSVILDGFVVGLVRAHDCGLVGFPNDSLHADDLSPGPAFGLVIIAERSVCIIGAIFILPIIWIALLLCAPLCIVHSFCLISLFLSIS